MRGHISTYIQFVKTFHGSKATGECEFYSIERSLEMTTRTICKERGFLDTGLSGQRSASRGSGHIRAFLSEAGQTLKGTFEAPLRYVLSPRGERSLERLSETTRRDIGL